MHRLSALSHSRSRASMMSDTTYHSFHDIELYEPEVSSSPANMSNFTADQCPVPDSKESAPSPTEMRRQDSGYASIGPQMTNESRRRTSTASSSRSRPKTRPSVRRAAASGPIAHLPRTSGRSLFLTQSSPVQYAPGTYFQFPSPDPPAFEGDAAVAATLSADTDVASFQNQDLMFPLPYDEHAQHADGRSETPTEHPLPPQTTHYWTSDRTRRLEYAAIDAASRGVKGWVMRHIVPECFVPKDRRRVAFDDDRGSVRRYRLELETDESAEKDDFDQGRRKKSWFPAWNLRASA